jgi:hypothetical protein
MLIGCAGSDPGTTPPPDGSDECQIKSQAEKTPGYPFDLTAFETQVLPTVKSGCGAAGACHGGPTGQGGFTVFADAVKGNCNFAKTFNNIAAKIDLVTANNSRLTAVVTGGSTTHPFKYDAASPDLAKLTAYITAAVAVKAGENGGGGPVVAGPGASPFDYAVFQSTIQPAINTAGCAKTGCHLSGAGGFTLKATPAADSQDMIDNFKAITSRTDLTTPNKSTIYVRATISHGGGLSTQVNATGASAMLDWIGKAKTANEQAGGGGVQTGCIPASAFNSGVFQSELRSIIDGAVDLNVPGQQGSGAGCTSTACHGTDRGPGKLTMLRSADTATVLGQFACFVNLSAPSASPIVQCPLNQAACPISHPGQNVFRDGADLNYQRFLGFIYGAKAASSPHDFAFFARRINPIFDDPAAVANSGQANTCSSSQGCHGVQIVGQSAAGGSDFPILSSASDLTSLTINFVSATGFVSFLNAQDSSLFKYPTNLIQTITGQVHPGGPDLLVGSQQANDILTFASGLRPDGQGFANNWLVVGTFAANQVTDTVLGQQTERTITPKIFDFQGGDFNEGQWDGLFSNNNIVDLNAQFPADAGQARVVYATTYLLNTDAFPRTVQIQINSPNALQLFLDGRLVTQAQAGAGANTTFDLSPAGSAGADAKTSARIMLKVFQAAADAQFQFTAQLRDQFDNVLTNANSGLVFTLGPSGGI